MYSSVVTNDYLNNLKTLPFNNSKVKYKSLHGLFLEDYKLRNIAY